MRILFHVEPVTFGASNRQLSPIMNSIRCLINANDRSDVSFGILSSRALLEEYDRWLIHGGVLSIYRKIVDEVALLRDFACDPVQYAQALFDPLAMCPAFEQALREAFNEFAPDYVIGFGQNSVLERLGPATRVLFAERGPLPRWNGRDNFYFDPGGHQPQSVLNRQARAIRSFAIDADHALAVQKRFVRLHAALPARRDAIARFDVWLAAHRNGRRVAMIANQPHDSLLVAGTTRGQGLLAFLHGTLDALPDGWMAFATYHPDMGDCSAIDQHMADAFHGFVPLPPELRQFGSDPFADRVDAVVTVGSKAALTAALLGRPVIANPGTALAGLGSSDPAALDDAPALTAIEAGRLLAFLSHRYTVPFETLFERRNFLVEHLAAMFAHEAPVDYLLDATDWRPQAFDRLFGLPATA